MTLRKFQTSADDTLDSGLYLTRLFCPPSAPSNTGSTCRSRDMPLAYPDGRKSHAAERMPVFQSPNHITRCNLTFQDRLHDPMCLPVRMGPVREAHLDHRHGRPRARALVLPLPRDPRLERLQLPPQRPHLQVHKSAARLPNLSHASRR